MCEGPLVKVSNTELYQEWLRYYETHNPDWPGYTQRTHAFFNSEKGLNPFWG